MSAPTFGDLRALDRPTFGADRIAHPCTAHVGIACPYPGPHRPPAPVDPATVPAFPDLEPAPPLWSAEPEPEPAPASWRIVDPLTGHTLDTFTTATGDDTP